MRPSRHPTALRSADECLLAAVRASDPSSRLRYAREGLDLEPADPEIRFLLHRQRYVAHLALHRFRRALQDAEAMKRCGVLRDVAYHDAARVELALGEVDRAVASLRFAARVAPAVRRSFHGWSLATAQHFAGRPLDALASLARAGRLSTRDRLLLRATAVFVRLDAGMPVRGAEATLEALLASPMRDGYGGFLAGMIALHLGRRADAERALRRFVARHEAGDESARIALRAELRAARLALAAARVS